MLMSESTRSGITRKIAASPSRPSCAMVTS
jgi:hypothetical protein